MQGVLVAVLVAAIAFLAGGFLMEPSRADILIGTIGGLIIAACVIGLIGMEVRKRHSDEFIAGRTDRWKKAQREQRKAAHLKAFWRSPVGQWIHKNPMLLDDSLDIQPSDGGKAPDGPMGLWMARISKTHVAYVEVGVPRRRKHWLMDRVTWLVNHRALPE